MLCLLAQFTQNCVVIVATAKHSMFVPWLGFWLGVGVATLVVPEIGGEGISVDGRWCEVCCGDGS